MNFYKYIAYGKSIVISDEDVSALDAFGALSDSMVIANRELLWNNPEAREGEWVLQETEVDFHTEYTYLWKQRSSFPLSGGILVD